MPIDPQAKVIIDLIESLGFAGFNADTDPVAMRALMEAAVIPSTIDIAHVDDREIPGPLGPIPIRIYRPDGDEPKPLIVYFHGGGWVLGSLASHDDVCRGLAEGVDAVVVAVDYRMAPEDRFPAAVEDAYAALVWTHAHAAELGGDASRVAVAGDSAGGNLAAVAAVRARDSRGPGLRFQLLIYPATDYEFTSGSMNDNAEGYFLTREAMWWFYGLYLNDPNEGEDPRVSPQRTADLGGLPSAFVLTMEYDPLRDQGVGYAEALRGAGTIVESKTYAGLFHGCIAMRGQIDAAQVAFDDAVRALRAGLA